jgi:hypothetical protein
MGINPRIMGVAPEKLDGVVSHGNMVHRLQPERYRLWVQAQLPGPLVDALGTGATQSQSPGCVEAFMPVAPLNQDAAAVYLDKLGLQRLGQSFRPR